MPSELPGFIAERRKRSLPAIAAHHNAIVSGGQAHHLKLVGSLIAPEPRQAVIGPWRRRSAAPPRSAPDRWRSAPTPAAASAPKRGLANNAQSPIAEISGSDVSNCSSTMMPDATFRPASPASSTLGRTPTPTTTRSAGIWRPSLRLTPVTRPPSPSMAVACTPRWMRIPAALCLCLKIFRDFGGHRARHDAGAEFDHIHLEALGPRGGGEFQPDEAGADHDDALARGNPPAQRLAFIERAQIAHVFETGVGNIEQAIARAGRQHQVPVIERGTRCELQLSRAAIDRDGAIGYQLDVLIAVEFVRPEHQAVRPAFAFQIGLRQWRPLVRQMGFIVEQADAPGKAMLAQRRRELKTRMAGADNEDRSLRHRDSPTGRAQGLPMSSASSSPIWCLPTSSRVAALVAASCRMGASLGLMARA